MGVECWFRFLKPGLQFLNGEIYCLTFVVVLEILWIQNLEQVWVGKGKAESSTETQFTCFQILSAPLWMQITPFTPDLPIPTVNEAFL